MLGKHELFGHGGGERIAQSFDVPFLGQVPLQPTCAAAATTATGRLADPESAAALAFSSVAGAVARQVSVSCLPGARQLHPARRPDH